MKFCELCINHNREKIVSTILNFQAKVIAIKVKLKKKMSPFHMLLYSSTKYKKYFSFQYYISSFQKGEKTEQNIKILFLIKGNILTPYYSSPAWYPSLRTCYELSEGFIYVISDIQWFDYHDFSKIERHHFALWKGFLNLEYL